MPELPEVEVVKRSLEKNINNLIFKKVIVNTNKLRYIIDRNKIKTIINKKILSIKRRSKYILIFLTGEITLLFHLGMTGKFFIQKNNGSKCKTSFYYKINKEKDEKHNHIFFRLSNKTNLIYNDVRKFGFFKILNTKNFKKNSHLKEIGPEPLSKKFNLRYFNRFIKNKNKKIKILLMDQKFVAGLGNIYVNEVLFLSKVNPTRNIKSLTNSEIMKIIRNIKKILKKSIIEGGSSIKDFMDSSGKKGNFQQNFYVYARQGEKCIKINCNQGIKKSYIGNRSTFFCQTCQK